MLERRRAIREVRARDNRAQPEHLARRLFANALRCDHALDAVFLDSREQTVLAAAGMPRRSPVVASLVRHPGIFGHLQLLCSGGNSVLLQAARGAAGVACLVAPTQRPPVQVRLPAEVAGWIASVFQDAAHWLGNLDACGQHVFDPRDPMPGPHFATNLLLGNRIGFPRPLQTTAKSVVDQVGRGSFRSHAATQVLATRWDLRGEENGFPANRQFYLVEEGRQIFYSADVADPSVVAAQTVHAQNRTVISYRTACGLEITRTIFLLPAEEEMPLATEVHTIHVQNHGDAPRSLRMVVTGMFGPAAPHALCEDVVYTNVSMQGRVLRNAEGDIVAVSPHYHPHWTKGDERFHTMIVHHGSQISFPAEFCTSYNEFVGEGTLERPQGLSLLSNRLSRKGPGFFALAAPLHLPPAGSVRVDNFTGLVSGVVDPSFATESLPTQIEAILARYSPEEALAGALAANVAFFDRFRRHLQVQTGDSIADGFVNRNLPFQILYQTLVSRSFDQTQKGHREIGFREVQDLFASLPFLVAMGERRFGKELLLEWAGQLHEFGYANHNFYWTGKEPGEFSDDALWFVQAVDRYLNLTDDQLFLDAPCAIADKPTHRRTVYAAIQAILRYSGEISVGKHGLPLLDRADWNDTLRLDPEYLNGPQKEDAYRRQLAAVGQQGAPLLSDNSESVMNAFLLKIALDATRRFATRRGDSAYATQLAERCDRLCRDLQTHAWKDDFFARVLINRPCAFQFLGAKGDGLSADPMLDGTYFLNSFSWAVLAGVADERQIAIMLSAVKRALLTPHGLRLCSPVNFEAITSRGGTAEYFSGDRENGGVFKHAAMMAAVAFLKAAKGVASRALAVELRDLALETIALVMPPLTMSDPYVLAGNPRFCTQYVNGETGEHVGPTLSGTAPWLWLALVASYGIQLRPEGIDLDPLLPDAEREVAVVLHTGRASYHIRVSKPAGLFRRRDDPFLLRVDGVPMEGTLIPHFADGACHNVELAFAPTRQ